MGMDKGLGVGFEGVSLREGKGYRLLESVGGYWFVCASERQVVRFRLD